MYETTSKLIVLFSLFLACNNASGLSLTVSFPYAQQQFDGTTATPLNHYRIQARADVASNNAPIYDQSAAVGYKSFCDTIVANFFTDQGIKRVTNTSPSPQIDWVESPLKVRYPAEWASWSAGAHQCSGTAHAEFSDGDAAFTGVGNSINLSSAIVQGDTNVSFTMFKPGSTGTGGSGDGCGTSPTWGFCDDPTSPIVIDVDQDGFLFGSRGDYINFDINADGNAGLTQWVLNEGDETFLVLDLNGNGLIDDGSELFGSGTWLYMEGYRASNGYIAMAQYDRVELGGNNDGFLTPADQVFENLLLWRDINADGEASENELSPIEESGLIAFETIPKISREVDAAGNHLKYHSSAYSNEKGRNKYRVVDVFFRQAGEE